MEQDKTKKALFTPEQMTELLESLYTQVTNGLPTSKPCEELAAEYLRKYPNPDKAVKMCVRQQVIKCTTSGFLTSLGGLITLPVAVPANLASVLYVQLRMIATIAAIGGYSVDDDEVETLVYMCLAGTSVIDACKQTGVVLANKMTTSFVTKNISGATIRRINHLFGFKLLTKFGEKGLINIGKLIPFVGGVVGGSFDFIGTHAIAKRAYTTFIKGQLT